MTKVDTYYPDEGQWAWHEVWSHKWNANFSITAHCAVQIADQLVVLAGRIAFSDNPIYRMNTDIFSIDLKTRELKKLRIKGECPSGRRQAGACSDGVHITLVGGVEENYNTLGDVWIYSTSSSVLHKEIAPGRNLSLKMLKQKSSRCLQMELLATRLFSYLEASPKKSDQCPIYLEATQKIKANTTT